ncbi:MAG: NADH:flavin oxidoreductase/NADH oxidase [Miniphocaeibacter sp.]|uniref:NADH:flavin oxidoreductase/NADH oxidase n=1 Tax=Miniphocaeibacter sp. TaxID=3100973 RepID=UPI0017A39273|nr:NADH:flavin oxidoreductase/NADH oxidase [Gallicola sp.]
MSLLSEYRIKNLDLKNRVVLPPMCMYSAENGFVNEFHKVHYGSFALGQVGLIILEATGVMANGRITDDDLGIYSDEYIDGLKSIVNFSHRFGSKVGIQLAHAGRKSETKNLIHFAPSAIKFNEEYTLPKEMDKEDIKKVIKSFGEASKRALEADFDLIEIHGAHGYLIHEFLSPITNKREDEYGGNLKNRTRLLKEILKEVKKYWAEDRTISLRISASDYLSQGIDINMIIDILLEVKEYIDIVHVSSGGLVPVDIKVYGGYQAGFAEEIKKALNMPVIAVGLLEDYNLANYLIEQDKCDLVAIGRGLLRNSNLVMEFAKNNKIDIDYLKQFERAY